MLLKYSLNSEAASISIIIAEHSVVNIVPSILSSSFYLLIHPCNKEAGVPTMAQNACLALILISALTYFSGGFGKTSFSILPPISKLGIFFFFFFFVPFRPRLLVGLIKLKEIRDWGGAWTNSACLCSDNYPYHHR